MALKRVSDLECKSFKDIETKVEDIFSSNTALSRILPSSKIEISEAQNEDLSLFKSYAYDLNALSGLFTYQLFHESTVLHGDKTFGDDVIINGSLSVVSEAANSNNNVVIDKRDVSITSQSTIDLTTNTNNITLSSGKDIKLNSADKIDINSTGGDVEINGNDIIIDADENLNLNSNANINLTYKDTFAIYFQPSSGDPIKVVEFGHNGDIPTVTFNSSYITASNPIDGVINKALWN